MTADEYVRNVIRKHELLKHDTYHRDSFDNLPVQ